MVDPLSGDSAALSRRLGAVLALCALAAFVSGAGLAAPTILPAAALLLLSVFWSPPQPLRRVLEFGLRALAVLLALRAAHHAFLAADDVVLPMVDLLLLLLIAELYRTRDGVGEARLYALTFALFIAAAAYRPGSTFALAFAVYLAVLTVSLIVGQLTAQARLRGLRPPRLSRAFLLQSASASGIALLISLAVFVGFPRVSWGARGAPPLRNVVGFADRVSLLEHGGRLYGNPAIILRVEFPGRAGPPPGPLYWRGRSYDTFDGWSWSRTPTRTHALIEPLRWPEARVQQLIYQASIGDANVLFGLAPLLHVTPRSRIVAYPEPNGDFTYGGPAAPVYLARSVAGQPSPTQLRAALSFREWTAGINTAAALQQATLRQYLRLPLLGHRFFALADSLARPHATDYDRALAVQQWLGTFRYTLELPATQSTASLEHFLFERRAGHCEYFSTAMAVLLRAMGIPARNVNGFLGGEWNGFGDFLTVTQNQAHSWVEVWFADYGWVRFDPTPADAGGVTAGKAIPAWLAGFRDFFAGIEHRWGKWVLDYDLDDQGRLFQHARGRFHDGPAAPPWSTPWQALLGLGGALVLIMLLAGLWRSWRARPHTGRARSPITRDYLRLRHAYQRLGFEPSSPPLSFLGRLELANAPAFSDAAAAIELYTRLRFGPAGAGSAERRQLRARVNAVRRRLRREPRRPRRV